jgi:hypothetical protein
MSRTPANITQADVARIIRAAKQAGADRVELRVGDTAIVVRLSAEAPDTLAAQPEPVVL